MRSFLPMVVSLFVTVVSLGCTTDSTTDVTVPPPVASLSVQPTNAAIQVGTSTQLSAITLDSSGGTLTGRVTDWSSSDERVARVVRAVGVVIGVAPGSVDVIATAEGKSARARITVTSATLTQLVLTPASITLLPGGTSQFAVSGKWSDSSTTVPVVTYSATGGATTASGLYTAGATPGAFRVIATQQAGTKADTSTVTVITPPPAPTLTQLVLTPASITLAPGGTSQFAVSGKWSDSSTTVPAVTYSATGGTITASGLYTAGATPGIFRVIATQQAGTMADTSTVTVITPPPPPPPPPSSCLRTVNASTLSGLTSALSGALPGDCILVAPGTYSLTSGLAINRSGTANAPITIEGVGSNTVIDVNQTFLNLDASYIHLRKIRMTDFGLSGFWAHNSTYNVIDSVEIDNTLQWAIALKDGSHDNVIKNSLIHDTGKGANPEWGEGIYISNSGDPGYPLDFTCTYNQILNNHFGPNVSSLAIILSEGADHTTIQGNVIDGTGAGFVPGYNSLIASFASYGLIDGNTLTYGKPDGITFYAPRTVTMAGNIISNNTIALYNIHNVTGMPYYGINLTVNTNSPSRADVKCSNVVTNIVAGGAFSNVACTP